VHRALVREVARRRQGDPLGPVTVVVPSRRAGLAARRLLGGASPAGIANVSFVTARWLAELLAGPALAASGRSPLTAAVAREALRAAVLEDPGPLGAAAANPLTLAALQRSMDRLRTLPPEALAALLEVGDGSPHGRRPWLPRLFSSTQQRLAGHYDGTALLAALRETVRRAPEAVTALGPILAWCPNRGDQLGQHLLAALGEAVTVIEPRTPAHGSPSGVIVATDPDEEVRAVVRRLLRWAEAGIAWHRMAVAYPVPHPYAAIVHQQLTAAGIAHNGPGIRTLASTAPGRLLRGLLDLAGTPLERPAVMAWLSSSPVIDPGASPRRRVPAARWDALSRRARVVEGPAQWRARLAHLADPANTDPHLHLRDSDRAEAHVLAGFVTHLAEALELPPAGSGWAAWTQWARSRFERYGGAPRSRVASGAAAELADAADAVLGCLDELAGLDAVGAPPTLDTFREAVAEALQAPFGRLGEFGAGVFVVPVQEAVTLPLDAVAVVGAVEGWLPRRPQVDPLLDTATASALEGALGSTAEQLEQQRQRFVLAVSAGARHRLVSLPRAELHSNRHHLPSRWLLDTTEALFGRRLRAGELLAAGGAEGPVDLVASYRAGLAESPSGSTQERRVATLAAASEDAPAGGSARHEHPAALAHAALGRGMQAITERLGGVFGPFTGAVDARLVPAFDPAHPMSPTALEHDAACPRRYLYGRRLGIEDLDLPEAAVDLSPLERGNLVHAILETFVRGLLADPPLDRSLERLLAVANELFTEYEARGVTGRALGWASAKRAVRRDLVAVHRRDLLAPLAVELPFGLDDAPAVVVTVEDGVQLAFRGIVDRVDRGPSGGLVVTDYKTGKNDPYRSVEETTVDGGTHLQLPIYALAAAQAFDQHRGAGPVHARYWFVNAGARYASHGYPVDDHHLDVFRATVGELAHQITSGYFPGRPERPVPGKAPAWNCRICPFDRICPADRATEWAAVRLDPRLARFVALGAEENGAGQDAGDAEDGQAAQVAGVAEP
jgi:RecB family exonuclease